MASGSMSEETVADSGAPAIDRGPVDNSGRFTDIQEQTLGAGDTFKPFGDMTPPSGEGGSMASAGSGSGGGGAVFRGGCCGRF